MRRRGRWTREPGVGWRLDGYDAVLDYDPHSGGIYALRGCWCLYGSLAEFGGPEEIDHFLDDAMAYVENMVDRMLDEALARPRSVPPTGWLVGQ